MRSLAPIAIIGSLFLVANVNGQSLTENAAAIAGATIGTAAGKPLGTALGNIFGKLDQDTNKAANPQTAKTEKEKKVEKPAAPESAKQSSSMPSLPSTSAGTGPMGDLKSSAASGGHSSRAAESEPGSFALPFLSPAPVAPIEPAVRQPSAADVANIRVGASGQDVQSALGVPESRVVIPGDDGRLLEICQYWSNGQPVGTVHMVDGQVVSVAPNSTN